MIIVITASTAWYRSTLDPGPDEIKKRRRKAARHVSANSSLAGRLLGENFGGVDKWEWRVGFIPMSRMVTSQTLSGENCRMVASQTLVRTIG